MKGILHKMNKVIRLIKRNQKMILIVLICIVIMKQSNTREGYTKYEKKKFPDLKEGIRCMKNNNEIQCLSLIHI